MNYEELVKSVYPEAICYYYNTGAYASNYTIIDNSNNIFSWREVCLKNKILCNWEQTSENAWQSTWKYIQENILYKLES